MPGSDPIPPITIWTSIHNGDPYDAGLLAGQRLEIEDGAWSLADDGAYLLDKEAYIAMRNGSVEGNLIVGGKEPMALVPRGGWAVLAEVPRDAA